MLLKILEADAILQGSRLLKNYESDRRFSSLYHFVYIEIAFNSFRIDGFSGPLQT